MSKKYITVDTKKFFSLVVRLGGLPDQMANATYSAVKRTLTQVRTEIGRIVPKEYQIKASDVKSAIGNPKVKKGRVSEASLLVKGHTLSFAHFRFTPTKRTKRKVPVKVKIFKQAAKKRVNTDPMPFIAHTRAVSDAKIQYNVFRRTGPERLPVTVLRSLSVPQMVGNEEVADKIQEFAAKKLEERIDHEIDYRLEKIKKGGK